MSQTQNVTTRRRRAAPVIPGRCGICNTQDPHRQYLHPPNNEILAVFRRISYQATMAHFYCDGCILRAEKKLDQDRRKRAATGNRSATVAAGLQRSAGNAAPHRTTNVTGTSSQSAESQELQPIRQPEAQLRPLTRSSIDAAYPPANDRSTAASDSGSLSSESTNTVIVSGQHGITQKRPRIGNISDDSDDGDGDSVDTPSPHVARFPTASVTTSSSASSVPAGAITQRLPRQPAPVAAAARIDIDDIVPPHLRVKPSQKKRVRLQAPPKRAGDVPRSPGGRPISLNEYVRSDGG